jgi:hypothetical protein
VVPGDRLDAALGTISAAAEAAGRDPASIGMEGRVSWGREGLDRAVDHLGRWESAGATHVSVNTMGSGFTSVAQHLEALGEIAATTR